MSNICLGLWGQRPRTKNSAWFLAHGAKRRSWQETARAFQTSWDAVFRSVEMAVDWGRAGIDLTGLPAAGVDEISWQKGQFLTLVYQIHEGAKRLLAIAEERKEHSLREFFVGLDKERCGLLPFVCADM